MGVTMIFQHNIIMMEDAYNNQQKNRRNQQTTVLLLHVMIWICQLSGSGSI